MGPASCPSRTRRSPWIGQDRLELGGQAVLVETAQAEGAHDALRVDEEGGGQAGHEVVAIGLVRGSSRIGQVAPMSSAKSRAPSAKSWCMTPRISSPSSACPAYASTMSGNSSRQGGHQVAQKLTSTGRPRSSESLTGSPSMVSRSISGAGSPTSGWPPTTTASTDAPGSPAGGGPPSGTKSTKSSAKSATAPTRMSPMVAGRALDSGTARQQREQPRGQREQDGQAPHEDVDGDEPSGPGPLRVAVGLRGVAVRLHVRKFAVGVQQPADRRRWRPSPGRRRAWPGRRGARRP